MAPKTFNSYREVSDPLRCVLLLYLSSSVKYCQVQRALKKDKAQ